MTEQGSWYNAWHHFLTITEHKNMVMRHCFRAGIYWQGLLHDLSKYSWTEFKTGVHYYRGTMSPNGAEKNELGYSDAWIHHKGRNKHHFEYWIDIRNGSSTPEFIGAPMPTRYVVEMFCDRVAACKVYQREKYTDHSALDYYMSHKSRVTIYPASGELLERLLTMLAERGEKETFRFIRKEIVKPKAVFGEGGRY